jgi:hypothetical protein
MANPGSARSPERLAPSNQRSSEVISGHQRSSAVISGHQRSSEVGEITREIGALHQPTHGREDDPEHVGEVTLGAPTLRRADAPLGPRCLRQTVLCPFGKRGKKSSSVAVRGHQRSSAVISVTHLAFGPACESSAVISGHQRSSVVLTLPLGPHESATPSRLATGQSADLWGVRASW